LEYTRVTSYGLSRVVDIAEHAAEDGDPDAARDEDVRRARVLGKSEVALRLLDFDLGADRQLDERTLERRVPQARAQARGRRARSAR
jgi:hypothetical protein